MRKAARKAWEYIGMLAASASLAMLLMQAFLVPDSLRGNVPAVAGVAAAALAVLTLLFYNRRTTHVTLAVIAAALVLFLLWLWRTPRLLQSFTVGSLIPVLFYLLTGGTSMAVFLLARTRIGLAALFLGGAAVGCGMRLIGYSVNTAAYLTLLGAALALFIGRQFGASTRRLPYVDMPRRHVAGVAVGLTVLAMAASLSAYALTDRITPVRLTASRDKIADWLQGKTEGTAGFGDSGTAFGRPIHSDDTPVMDVRTDGPAYLKGNSYSTYTGHGWDRLDIPSTDKMVVIYRTRLVAPAWMPGYLYANDPAAFHTVEPLRTAAMLPYYHSHDTAVTLQDMTVTMLSSTSNLFLPEGYVDSLHTDIVLTNKMELAFNNPVLLVENRMRQRAVFFNTGISDFGVQSPLAGGATYSVTAPRYDMASAAFQTAANAGEMDLDDMTEAIASYYGDSGLATEFRQYYGLTRETYTRPDAAVTARTRQLAQRLTRACRTDTEKVEAVKAYLTKGFSYTLSPKVAPDGRDFVDYFLFSSKEGYCVHFATAMAVLLRCAGVPARYVEGYVTPPSADEGVYHVTENQAHAWVEVNSPLLGWYPVEATPGFDYVGNSASGTAAAESSAASSQTSSAVTPQTESGGASTASSASSTPQGGKKTAPMDGRALLPWALLLLAVILLLIFPGRLALRRLCLRRLRRRRAGEQVTRLYGGLLCDLGKLGLGRHPDETPTELAARVGAVLDVGEWNFARVTRLFEWVCYGGEEPGSEELLYIWRFRAAFPGLCRRFAGRLRCLIHGIY